jgi:predicted MFS family arabinose efflux permease
MKLSLTNSRTVAWTVWMIASIFYAYQYILRVMPSIMLDDIMQQFRIGAATFGQFSGIYYIGYSLMHLPLGIFLDRFGPRKIMSGCILLTVVGMLPLIVAEHWIYPVMGRLFIGLGSSAAILGVFKIIRMSFSETRFPRLLSFSVTIGLLGAIYGGGPISYMRDLFGHQFVIQLLALGGLLLAGATYWIVPDIKNTKKTSVWSDIKEVLSQRKLIALCLFAGLMVGPLEGFADVWGTVFLKEVYGIEGTLAASLPSMIFIGMCFGGPLLSFCADKGIGYLVTIIGAGGIMALSFLSIFLTSFSPAFISILFILIGVCSAYQILAIYKASTYTREHVAGLTTAVANMIIMIFGYAFHSVIGGIVNAYGGPHQPHALLYGIGIIPIALLIGIVGFSVLLVQERRAATTGLSNSTVI